MSDKPSLPNLFEASLADLLRLAETEGIVDHLLPTGRAGGEELSRHEVDERTKPRPQPLAGE